MITVAPLLHETQQIEKRPVRFALRVFTAHRKSLLLYIHQLDGKVTRGRLHVHFVPYLLAQQCFAQWGFKRDLPFAWVGLRRAYNAIFLRFASALLNRNHRPRFHASALSVLMLFDQGGIS